MRSHGSTSSAGRARSAIRNLRGSARLLMLVATVLVLSVAGAVAVYMKWRRPVTLAEELAAAEMPRKFAVQISVPTRFRPCRMEFTPGRIPSAQCAGASEVQASSDMQRLVGRISAQADSANGDAIHADALLDLEWDTTDAISVTRVIDRLQRLSRRDYHRIDSLTDLSAAYIVRAGITQQMLDLVGALEASEQALEIDSKHREALFNRALALHELAWDGEAAKAWRDYLALDPDGAWAEEARWYEGLLHSQPRSAQFAGANDSTLAAFAIASPQQARELGWDNLLGQWGDAVLRNDTAAARAALHRAGVIGEALESSGRDASLADEVRVIGAQSGKAESISKLAEAHRLFAAARREYLRVEYTAADTLFEKAFKLAGDSPILQVWARAFYGAAHRVVDRDSAYRVAKMTVAGVDTLRYTAIAGRAYWTLGAFIQKTDSAAPAAKPYQTAIRVLQRAGEEDYAASVKINLLDLEFPRTDAPEPYFAAWWTAASTLRAASDLPALHRAFALMSRRVAEAGFPRSALHVNEELAAIDRRNGVKVLQVEAQDYRAEGLARTGDMAGAAKAIAAAEVLLPEIDPRAAKAFSALLGATRGMGETGRNPRDAEARLSSAIDLLRSAGIPVRLTALLLARADARVALGKTDAARQDLLDALAMIRSSRLPRPSRLNPGGGPDARATLNRAVARLVAEGRDTAALALLEHVAVGRDSTPLSIPVSLPPGRVVVRFAVIGDTVLAWTWSGTRVNVTPIRVPRAELRDRVHRALTALEQREDDQALPELRKLYEWLIGPVEARLGPDDSELVIVPDDELEAVPFVALIDAQEKYLLERYVVSISATLAGAARASNVSRVPTPPVAGVVQDPTIDRELYRGLPQLAGAQQEVAALDGWTRRTVLSGSQARADSVRSLLSRVSLLHFAGHAVADPAVADSSYLVLSAVPGREDLSRLTAAEISAMDLNRVDLVVLSACSTLGGSDTESGGFAGLSGAFLGAGAKGVIGSLWSVNDDRTRELIQRFYDAYRTNRDPAAALRQAQLGMLDSHDARWSSPAGWAAFEYVGR